MNERVALLKELVADEHYVIDDMAVADAIVVRSAARRLLPDVSFRSTRGAPLVRSFRPHRGARSFRLSHPERRPLHRRDDAPVAFALR